MSTRSFAQSIAKFQPSIASGQAVYRLACSPAMVLQGWWQVETARRRRLRLARELSAMSDHTLRDIGVSRSDWVARPEP